MKKKNLLWVFLLAAFVAAGTPLFAQPRPTGLRLTQNQLRQASQPAVMSMMNLREQVLPTRVNLAEGGLIVAFDQGRAGTCGPVATAMAKSLIRRLQQTNPVLDNRTLFSPSFLYSQTMIGNDQGSTFPDNLNVIKNIGISSIISFPYSTQNLRLQPSALALREANRYRLSEWRWIQHDCVDTFRSFLAKGKPIMIAIRVSDNFFNYQGGIYSNTGTPNYNHGVYLIGYDDDDQTFIAMNSYGTSFGENFGTFRFSYNTLRNTDSLVIEAYIMIPAAINPRAPNFPSNFEATRGVHSDRVVLSWSPEPNAFEYEVFRLHQGQYVSLGTTTNTSFTDLNVQDQSRYFYLVRTHTRQTASDYSFPTEGWANSNTNTPPGIPTGLTGVQNGNSITLNWNRVDRADSYSIFTFRASDWIKVGETSGISFVDPSPLQEGNTSISYMIIAENRHGRSLPSNSVAVIFERHGRNDNTRDFDNRNNEGKLDERYTGNFYRFDVNRFVQWERAFFENFTKRSDQIFDRFRAQQERVFENFTGGGR
jgi:hypothetical protein